jgi:crotonobetainyl-CoA:carnitine CoA-transferase CaiB-like acyl-CoA transferase
MSQLPYAGIRIIELSKTLAGRLAGQLFADQGAEVLIERESGYALDEHDEYFDRNKTALPPGGLADTASADVIIVDGEATVDRAPAQIVLRVTAALPGDEAYGHLDANCSEDLINALVGFFTDMGTTSRPLGRPVIYTPLPLCSVYTGVAGAIGVAAAMADRTRCGQGREVTASRIAGGLTAIGAMSFTTEGLDEHLGMAEAGALPEGITPEEFKTIVSEASKDASKQLWLEQRIIPLAAPYYCSDDNMVLMVCMVNRRLAQRLLKQLGIYEDAMEAGMVDVDPYDPANLEYRGRNIADSVNLNYPMSSKLADLLAEAFKRKTAVEWEPEMCEAGIPLAKVNSFEEWLNHPHARASGIIAEVEGHDHLQIGRAAWVGSAQPYPELRACESMESVPPRSAPLSSTNGKEPAKRPLEGFTVVDFTNVVAGPNSGRMFAELGATVYWLCPINPQHPPVVMVAYTSEAGVGKRSIILDMKTDEGREIMNKIVAKADMILANKLDDQMERMGLDRKALDKLNPALIGIQLSAHRGEKPSARQNWPGYDPVAQAFTGIMDRFGPEGCPTFHGVASCVDYLCGYLGTWAGLTALQARERRKDGQGDWAETSLFTAASLTQCNLQQAQLPESAQGAYATGMNEGERVYQLSDGWIFAQGDHDLSEELASTTVEAALALLGDKGIPAVPVQTCRELADRHRDNSSTTVRFETREESDGWVTENYAPTWFTFDGESVPCPGAPQRVGSEAPTILAELGYSSDDVDRLISSGVVGQTEWAPVKVKI